MEQSPVRGMWGRYALFIILSFGYLFLAQYFLIPRAPKPQQGAKGPDAPKEKGDPGKEKLPPAKPGEKEAPKTPGPAEKQPAKAAAKPPAQAKFPDAYPTLGSRDPKSPYRMLFTLTNRGGAIQRIELNSPRFHDLEDKSGDLGHIVVDENVRGPGCPVQVVGAGTPAEEAGLVRGDVIQAVDGLEVNGWSGRDGLEAVLSKTRPGQTIALSVRRKGDGSKKDQVLELSCKLTRHPLAVVRPEAGAPPSLLMTLSQIDDKKLEEPEGDEAKKNLAEAMPAYPSELEGVDLRTANWEVDPQKDPARVTFRRYLPKWELEVVKTFALAEVPAESAADSTYKAYHLTFEVQIINKGKSVRKVAYEIDGPNGLPTEGWWYASKVYREWRASGLRDVVAGFRLPNGKTDLTTQSTSRIVRDNPGPLVRPEPLQFIGVDAQYFDVALIPQPDDPSEVWFDQWETFFYGPVDRDLPTRANASFWVRSVPEEIKPQAQSKGPFTRRFLVFAGPKKPDLLAHYGLGDVVYYGWYGWVAKPLLLVLHTFYRLIPNYGIAILLLTVLVRGCMYPLSRKQAQSAQKMQELQPELKRIHEKYKSNLDARNKAQQELFRKHHFHPMGGCLPMFVQLPIFVGLYRALMVDVELRQAPLITEGLGWATNLAAPDMLFNWSDFMPAFITKGTGMFGLGPYFNLLPLLTIFMLVWQQKKFSPAPADEKAAMQMRIMKYMMVFMGILFFKVASGLCVYFIASSLWSIAERKYLPKTAPSAQGSPPSRPVRPPAPGPAARDGSPARKKKSRRR